MKKLLFLFTLLTLLITTSCEKEDDLSNDLFTELTTNQWLFPYEANVWLEFTTDYQVIKHTLTNSLTYTTYKLGDDLIYFEFSQLWYPISIKQDTLRIKYKDQESYYIKKH